MQKRVTDLVLESFGTQSYKKAMDCLRVLREESIKVLQCLPFTVVDNFKITIHRPPAGSKPRPRGLTLRPRDDKIHILGVEVVPRSRSQNYHILVTTKVVLVLNT